MNILNLGCGNDIIVNPNANIVHLNKVKHRPEVDVVWDLNDLPWPFEDETFDLVKADSVLEHLYHNLLTSMEEIWRILKPGGIAHVKLPYWKSEVTWCDSTHIHKVGLGIFDQLCPATARGQEYDFYTPYKWEYAKGPRLNRSKSSVHVTMRKLCRK